MDHAEVLELLEIAAVEPDALNRLMAGDTPESMAVAGHLAGCPECASQLEAIRRTAAVAREVIQTEPDPALRERTLSYVRAIGRRRGAAGAGAATDKEDVRVLAPGSQVGSGYGTRRRASLAVAAAAVLVVASAGAGYLLGQGRGSDSPQGQERQVAILADAAATTIRVTSAPDAQRVVLTSTADAPGAAGSIVFSAGEGELVATATGLPAIGNGQEYGCWVEVAGQRMRLGRMYWAGDVWTWAGPAQGLDSLPPGSTFGVSVDPEGGGSDATPVLTGTL
jgi:hypothetical protein